MSDVISVIIRSSDPILNTVNISSVVAPAKIAPKSIVAGLTEISGIPVTSSVTGTAKFGLSGALLAMMISAV